MKDREVELKLKISPQPDTKVLDFERLLLPDFLNGDNLSSGLLELPQLSQEIPKPVHHHET